MSWALAISVLCGAAAINQRDRWPLAPITSRLLLHRLEDQARGTSNSDQVLVVLLRASECGKQLQFLAGVEAWGIRSGVPVLAVVAGTRSELYSATAIMKREHIALRLTALDRRDAALLIERVHGRYTPIAIRLAPHSAPTVLSAGAILGEDG